jgi:hypothetical protein
MSYLDVPRIQFGSLFYTNPDTIDNITRNYDPRVDSGWRPVAPRSRNEATPSAIS